MKIDEALQSLSESPKRGFVQSYDLVVILKNIDLKKPENKFSKDIVLPNGRGKDVNVCIISDRIDGALTKTDVETIDKKGVRELTKKYEFFLCEAPLMPLVGKVLGKYLGPKGKMPKLLPPNTDPASQVAETKKSVRIRVRDSPVIQVIVGTESMPQNQVKENIERVLEEIKKTLPKGVSQIKMIMVKLTMNKPVKLDM
ncbi:MAG: 50S ribosomal protein L1 [Candidatus Aenigmarchaeota archaeon]|nr:50S ribosomal protein L1 [Candidatus Aenigmarchaeota archaeon]